MQEHYGFSDEKFSELLSSRITIADLFHAVPLFKAENAPVSKVSLMYYADAHGDFTEGKSKTDAIARAVFDRLPMKEKLEVGEYLEDLEDGEF